MHRDTGAGMFKFQLPGMQRLSGKTAVILVVEKITRKGMSDVFHVDADLMGASRFQAKLCERIAVPECETSKMCDCFFAGFIIDLPLNGGIGTAPDRSTDGSAFGKSAGHDGQIRTVNLPADHLLIQDGCTVWIFGQNQKTGCVTVQTIDAAKYKWLSFLLIIIHNSV